MTEPLLVVYSHSSYLDILQIQTHYLKHYKNKILLIDDTFDNKNFENNYSKVIKYSNSIPYASRLALIQEIEDEYFIFINEKDILIQYELDILNLFKTYMRENNIDKIEFQHWHDDHPSLRHFKPPVSKRLHNIKNPLIKFHDICYLYKLDHPNFYTYNVNPTMWNKKSFLKIMNTFSYLSYKQIEESKDLQKYVSRMNCFSLLCEKPFKEPLHCGHFTCGYFFQYIAITHGGKICTLHSPKQLDPKVYPIYKDLCNKFFRNTKRQWRVGFPL